MVVSVTELLISTVTIVASVGLLIGKAIVIAGHSSQVMGWIVQTRRNQPEADMRSRAKGKIATPNHP